MELMHNPSNTTFQINACYNNAGQFFLKENNGVTNAGRMESSASLRSYSIDLGSNNGSLHTSCNQTGEVTSSCGSLLTLDLGNSVSSGKVISASPYVSRAIPFLNSFISSDMRSEGLRSRLPSVKEKFSNFENVVVVDSRRRRLENEEKYKGVKDSIMRMEKHLNLEINRRIECMQNLKDSTEKLANEMLDNLQSKLFKRIENIARSLDNLLGRCEILETGIAEMKGLIPSKLYTDADTLTKNIREFLEMVMAEKNFRQDRDSIILKRIDEFEYSLEFKVEEENMAFEKQLNYLSKQFAELSKNSKATNGGFGDFLRHEFSTLYNALNLAAAARDSADREIMQTVNQYNVTLEKSLRIVSMK